MGVLLAVDEELAERIEMLLPGKVVTFTGADLRGVKPEEWPEEGPAQIIAAVEAERPEALILGVRLGGQRYRALDAVAQLLNGSEAMSRPPAVVLLVPRVTMAVAREAWTLGCYAMIDASSCQGDDQRLASILADAAMKAKVYRKGWARRALRSPLGEPPPRVAAPPVRAARRPGRAVH